MYINQVKKMLTPSLKIVPGVGQKKRRKTKENSDLRVLYTAYNTIERKLMIGVIDDTSYKLVPQKNFKVIATRNGYKNEEKVLKQALLELGYQALNDENIYQCTKEIKRHLAFLGWPIETCYRKKMKY